MSKLNGLQRIGIIISNSIVEGINNLNGWQRIAIIISVIAFFPLFLKFTDNYTDSAIKQSYIGFERCMSVQETSPSDKDNCLNEISSIFSKKLDDSLQIAFFGAFFSIVIFWVLLVGFINIISYPIKWVIEGFRKP